MAINKKRVDVDTVNDDNRETDFAMGLSNDFGGIFYLPDDEEKDSNSEEEEEA